MPEILVKKEMLNERVFAPFGFIYCDYNFYAMVRKNNENRDVMNIIDWLMAEEKVKKINF